MRAYHLTSATHALSNLRHRRLKIATFEDLNDPFELWAVAQPDKELRRGLRRWEEQIAKQYGLLCFISKKCPTRRDVSCGEAPANVRS